MGKLKKLRKKMLGAAARTTNRVELLGTRPRARFNSESVVVDTEWDLISAPEDDADTAEYGCSEDTTQSDSPPQPQVDDPEGQEEEDDDPLLQDAEGLDTMSAGEPHAGTPPLHNHINTSLLNQLRQKYEEVPENIVIKVLKENPNNLSKVLEILKQESEQRLYGQFVSATMPEEVTQVPSATQSPANQLARQMSNLYMPGSLDSLDRQRSHSGSSTGAGAVPDFSRQRSDSLESRGSGTSIGSSASAGRVHLQGYGTAGGPVTAGGQQQAQYSSMYIQMANNSQGQQQPVISRPAQQPGGAVGVSYYPGTNIPYLPGTSIGQVGGITLAGNPTSLGHSTSKTAVPERPPPPKFSMNSANMYHGATNSTQHGQVTTPPRPGQIMHSPHSAQMHNSGVNHNTESPSRPGHFGQQFPNNNSGSQYSSPSTPSPHRPGSLPYTPPRQVSFSPTVAQSSSPVMVTVGSPKTAGSLHTGVGSPPPVNHTSQMYIQIATGQTIPVAQVQSPSPGNPTLGYIIQQGVTTPGSGGSTPTQSSFVFIPASNFPPDSGIPAQPVTLSDLQTGAQQTVAVPLDKFARQEDGAYTNALIEHQHACLNELSQDLGRTYIMLDQLKRQVGTMEQDLLEKRRRKADAFPSAKDVQKMRDDNRRMTIDIHLMTREVDGCSRGGQIPLGVVDNSFFSTLETGQQLDNNASPSRNIVPSRPAPPPPVTSSAISLPPLPSLPSIPHSLPPNGPYYPAVNHTHDFAHRCPRFHQHQPHIPCPYCQYGHSNIPSSHPPPPPYMPPTPQPPTPHQTTLTPAQEDEGEPWNCSACTFQNHPALEKCEVCEMPRIPIPGEGVPGHQMGYNR